MPSQQRRTVSSRALVGSHQLQPSSLLATSTGTASSNPNTNKGIVATTTGRSSTYETTSYGATTAASGAGALRQYGDIVTSDEVHGEIRALGKQVRNTLATRFPLMHGTQGGQVLAGVRAFGPSQASRDALTKENEAALLARDSGLYFVWRCVSERVGGAYRQPRGSCDGYGNGRNRGGDFTRGAPHMLSGATDDFCTRIGPRSRCFCGHSLCEHGIARVTSTTTAATLNSCKGTAAAEDPCSWPCEANACPCRRYRYIPNCPEDIGEAWLSRRRGWDPLAWSPKCRCGHGCLSHDAFTLKCNACRGCFHYESHFLCVVCDQPWEAHETVVETESERLRAGRPVGPAFAPLQGVDEETRTFVLDAPRVIRSGKRGGGVGTRGIASGPNDAKVENTSLLPPARTGEKGRDATSTAANTRVPVAGTGNREGAGGGEALELPPHCPRCGAVYRGPASKFCSKCGAPRRT